MLKPLTSRTLPRSSRRCMPPAVVIHYRHAQPAGATHRAGGQPISLRLPCRAASQSRRMFRHRLGRSALFAPPWRPVPARRDVAGRG